MLGSLVVASVALSIPGVIPASAEEPVSVGPLEITRRIVRGVDTPGEAVAGYLRIRNAAASAAQLIAVSCDCAERIEFHQIRRGATGVSMDAAPAWDIPGEGQLDIRPGSDLHLMLIGYDPSKAIDGKVMLVLRFQDGVERTADFALVEDSRAAWATFD